MRINILTMSFIWSCLSGWLPRLIQPLTFIILARILTPKDFGLMGMVVVVISFVNLLKDGISMSLIRAKDESDVNLIFWMQFTFGIVIYLTVFACSPFLATYYHEQMVIPMLRVLALIFIMDPFVDVPVKVMMRRMEFKPLFFRQTIPIIASASISIVLGLYNFGVWALILGQVIGIALTAAAFMIWMRWKPHFSVRIKGCWQHLSFGGQVIAQTLAMWLMAMSGQFFLCRFQPTLLVGNYVLADRASSFFFALLVTPINQVLFPYFSEKYRNGQKLDLIYLKAISTITLFTFPIGTITILCSYDLVSVMLGTKWLTMVNMFQYMMLSVSISTMVSLNREVFKAIGKPYAFSRIFLPYGILAAIASFYIAQIGSNEVAICGAIATVIFAPARIWITLHFLGASWKCFLQSLVGGVSVSLSLVICYYLITPFTHGFIPVLRLLLFICVFLAHYAILFLYKAQGTRIFGIPSSSNHSHEPESIMSTLWAQWNRGNARKN